MDTREDKCAARGPGLLHTQDLAKRPDGACLECGQPLQPPGGGPYGVPPGYHPQMRTGHVNAGGANFDVLTPADDVALREAGLGPDHETDAGPALVRMRMRQHLTPREIRRLEFMKHEFDRGALR